MAATLEQARTDFAEAWLTCLPRYTRADVEGYRRQREPRLTKLTYVKARTLSA